MKYVVLITIGFISSFSWLLIKPKATFYPFFLLPEYQDSKRWYFFMLTFYLLFAIFAFLYHLKADTINTALIMYLFIGLFISYILNGNQPYFYIKDGQRIPFEPPYEAPEGFFIPFSYPLIMGVLMIINAIHVSFPKLYNWFLSWMN